MDKLLVLHLEDNPDDAFFVRRFLEKQHCAADIIHVLNRDEYVAALEQYHPDLILSDDNLPNCSSLEALEMAKAKFPEVPFMVLTGLVREDVARRALDAGAVGVVPKNQLAKMLPILLGVRAGNGQKDRTAPQPIDARLQRLVQVVQDLSHARDLPTIMKIVCTAARQLTGADGATFILREEDQCFYADEDAPGPLWKGRRFPLQACISGWVMLNCKPAVIEDIYIDPRIPVDAYSPTFVKSLLMVPIGTAVSLGAVGVYWARTYKATDTELELLQTLANTTAVALENVRLFQDLNNVLRLRSAQLDAATRELEAYSWSVAHDLRSPLHNINVYALLLQEEYQEALDKQGREFLGRISSEADRMAGMIDNLHWLANYTSAELKVAEVNLSLIARDNLDHLRTVSPRRAVEIRIQDDMKVRGDPDLLKVMLGNLLANAWKYTLRRARACIDVGMVGEGEGEEEKEYYVRDNGVGFDMRYAGKLYMPFQQLHSDKEFRGTGLGLATVKRIINRHGGSVRAEARVDHGATFFFTLPPMA
jgi:hypothetical protein